LQFYDPFYEAIFKVEDVIVCSDGGYAINGTCIDQETTMGWGFVIKTDSEGNLLWAEKDIVDFQAENDSRAFVETEDGGFISSSYYWVNGSAIIKRNSNGVIQNSILLEDIAVNSMGKTNDNNVILTGHNYVNYQTGDDWPCLIKMNQDLEIIWEKIYRFEDYQWGVIDGIIEDSNSGFLLAGRIRDEMTEDAILVIKTNSVGDTLWTRILDETDEDDKAKSIIETDEGDILVGGYLEGITAGFLWKLDIDGNTIWFESGNESCGYGFTSFSKLSDGKIISTFGDIEMDTSIRKFDSDYNIDWTNNLEYFFGHGDKTIRTTDDDYILIGLLNSNNATVGLMKLNSNGTATNDEEVNEISKKVLINYPNPFNPVTTFSFSLSESGNAEIVIFNTKGQIVSTLKKNNLSLGKQTILWDAGNHVSGIYFAQLKLNNKTIDTKKIVLIK
jgi:hypothetical protein